MSTSNQANAAKVRLVDLPFDDFHNNFKNKLHTLFNERTDLDKLATQRGLPPYIMREIAGTKFMTAFIPEEYGGRGGKFSEAIQMVSSASYESLALGLMFGINWGLFLQPVTKYGSDEAKKEIFHGFIKDNKLGGLMITEPDYGSDALNMQTNFVEHADVYHLQGTKHWAGLTGWADYWLLTARRKGDNGNLHRDIEFFICDNNVTGQIIEVEEYFDNLGLYMIPYGRNKVDVRIPKAYKLQPHTNGVSMMLDTLHRNRMLIPAMAMGFTQRMLDEGIKHCDERIVGGRALSNYDQVQKRLAALQAAFTITSAMCADSAKNAVLEKTLLADGIKANAMKSHSTDLMQDASQQLFQLTGAKGYKLNHIAGRSMVDSRPFQIFEGPNDILYIQIAEQFLKRMKRGKELNLLKFCKEFDLTKNAANLLTKELDFSVDIKMSQRKLTEFGSFISRIISTQLVINLGNAGFNNQLIENTVSVLSAEIKSALTEFVQERAPLVISDYASNTRWRDFI